MSRFLRNEIKKTVYVRYFLRQVSSKKKLHWKKCSYTPFKISSFFFNVHCNLIASHINRSSRSFSFEKYGKSCIMRTTEYSLNYNLSTFHEKVTISCLRNDHLSSSHTRICFSRYYSCESQMLTNRKLLNSNLICFFLYIYIMQYTNAKNIQTINALKYR